MFYKQRSCLLSGVEQSLVPVLHNPELTTDKLYLDISIANVSYCPLQLLRFKLYDTNFLCYLHCLSQPWLLQS
jgi:hypothetical protein